jgi:putative Flp pilus-assembly TadE/G-like protein
MRSSKGPGPRRAERGATLAVMALMMALALGMSAMAIDYGMIKATKAEAQRAMDAAALAGASAFLIADPTTDFAAVAEARARDYAKLHQVHRVQITDPEVTVDVDLVNKEVRATYAGGDISLWFARTLGINTMRLGATATAKASETGKATCIKPVALPDMWNNVNNVTVDNGASSGKGKGGSNGGTPIPEDANNNHVWDYVDRNGNGYADPGEWEPWTFNTGDIYDPPVTGYGTTYRNSYGSGSTSKPQDYGRQVLLQTFDANADRLVSSYFRTWMDNSNTGGTDSLAAGIRGDRCPTASLGTEYQQANGAKEPLQNAWEYLINQDPSAHWSDATGVNTVVGSSYGDNWLNQSPRVVVVGLYPPTYATSPSSNPIEFSNLAKIWIDQRPCGATGGLGQCKTPITARFLGYVNGGAGGETNGSLVWRISLIK